MAIWAMEYPQCIAPMMNNCESSPATTFGRLLPILLLSNRHIGSWQTVLWEARQLMSILHILGTCCKKQDGIIPLRVLSSSSKRGWTDRSTLRFFKRSLCHLKLWIPRRRPCEGRLSAKPLLTWALVRESFGATGTPRRISTEISKANRRKENSI